MELDRETYKRIKHMDKVELSNYLVSVYQKGSEAGINAAANMAQTKPLAVLAQPNNAVVKDDRTEV